MTGTAIGPRYRVARGPAMASGRRTRHVSRRAGGVNGNDENGDRQPAQMSEEMLNRLREAEAEAAELRKQLADLKSNEEEGEGAAGGTRASTSGRLPNRPEVKVDSVSTRENFLYPQSDVWLGGELLFTTTLSVYRRSSQKDAHSPLTNPFLFRDGRTAETNAEFAQFMAKDGVSESSYQTGVTEEEKGEVRRRLLLGIVGTAVLGALALVPTEMLDPTTPSQPAFAYLVPVLEGLQVSRRPACLTIGRTSECVCACAWKNC